MRRVRAAALIAALLSVPVALRPAAAELQPVFSSPGVQLSIKPVGGSTETYGRARGSATWHVAQWDNPSGNIRDFAGNVAANDSMTVRSDAAGHPGITIQQTGQLLRCEVNGAPLEFDGLIGTNTAGNDSGLPTAELGETSRRPLARYGVLRQHIELRLVSAELLRKPEPCPVSKAVSLVTLVATNTQMRSTLFVQFILYAFNSAVRDGWWAVGRRNGRYGFNYVLPPAKTAWSPGEARQFDFDMVPIIEPLITQNTVGMDQDLDHWIITGAYFGNAIYGDVALTTSWSDYRLGADFH